MWGHKISGLCSQLSYTPIGESYSSRSQRKMQVFSSEILKKYGDNEMWSAGVGILAENMGAFL